MKERCNLRRVSEEKPRNVKKAKKTLEWSTISDKKVKIVSFDSRVFLGFPEDWMAIRAHFSLSGQFNQDQATRSGGVRRTSTG